MLGDGMENILSSLIDKVDDLLYEVIGLLIPSLILCIILFEPVFYVKNFSLENIPLKVNIESFWMIIFIIVIFYVIGNVIKVVSKIYYNLWKAVFDDTIFPLIFYMFNHKFSEEDNLQVESDCEQKPEKKLKDEPAFTIFNVFYEWIMKTLSFSVESYDKKFERIYIDLAMKKLKIFSEEKEKNKNWYLFYKKAITILDQNNIKTLYYKHLSKYNSFRSLECVFFCGIIYNIFWRCTDGIIINYQIYNIILGINIVCVVSFHEKYKRYWKLCGNEVIFGLDYFYNNEKGSKR